MEDKVKHIEINEEILHKLSDIANEAGIQVFAVGGYVRDYLLGIPNKDIDCTVIGDSIKFARLVAKRFGVQPVIYERFKTALVPVHGWELEFVGTRKEEYKENSRKPIVTEGTFYDDIKRRDFTVNAMAVSLNKENFGELIDYFNGQEDLKNGILRTPLEPETTYSDDPLRMMRAFRFASKLNFRLVDESIEAIEKMAKRIEIISQERITDEFLKMISSPNPSTGLLLMKKTGLLKYVFPELDELAGVDVVEQGDKKFGHKDVFKHSVRVLMNIVPKTDKLWLRFTALVHDIAKPRTKRFSKTAGWTFHGHEEVGARMMKKIFRRMKFPMDNLPYVEKLIRLHQRPMVLVDDGVTDSAIRRLAAKAGSDLEDLFTLVRADITTRYSEKEEQYKENYEIVFRKILDVQEKDKLREFQSPVRGEEIMEVCNLEPCRAVGVIKTNIEEAILDGIIPNEYEAAQNYFVKNKDKWLQEAGDFCRFKED